MARKPVMPVAAVAVPGRCCWECAFVYYSAATAGYSEMTPGSDFHLSCGKQYWEMEAYDTTLETFAAYLKSAERCASFSPRQEQR